MNAGSTLALYLGLGFRHILDVGAADHLLFITALVLPHGWRDWRRLLGLVTGFTVGHSATLAAATIGLIPSGGSAVEIAIAVTILITAAFTLWANRSSEAAETATSRAGARYLLAIAFGLVHGLGFSSYLRSVLGPDESILAPLFWFNVGLEGAQLLVVAGVLAGSALAVGRVASARVWRLALSASIVAVSAAMIVRRLLGVG